MSTANVIPIDATAPTPEKPATAHDFEAEKAVLGAALIKPSCLGAVCALLDADDFYLPAHVLIFEAMVAVAGVGAESDFLLLADELRRRSVLQRLDGQEAYLIALTAAVPTAENVGHYAEIVARKSAVRALARNCIDLAAAAETDPDHAAALVISSQRLVTEIAKGRRKPGVDLADIVQELEDEFEARQERKGRLLGITTGIKSLDYLTGGLVRQNLHILAARTSLGKTALACQIAINGALHRETPCFYASLEMPAAMLGERFFSHVAQVDSQRLRTGDLDVTLWSRIHDAGAKMRKPGRVTITRDRSLAAIIAQARAFRVEHARTDALVVIDYLQLVRTAHVKGRSREQEVAEVSSALKELAGDLDCPVLALCQFNRGPEAEDRDPKLTDIRESGAIENDADLIVFIVRRRDGDGDAYLHVAKSRNGEIGNVAVRWHGPTYTFAEDDGR